MTLRLHSYWRATAPYRVRIGLGLKELDYDYAAVDLAGGQQREAGYRALNPQGLAPALEVDGQTLTQSLAILEWLEETHPQPALLPRAPLERATVRAMAAIVACDIHPLNNLRVTRRLSKMGLDAAAILDWTQGWIREGFDALEPMVARHGRGFAFGDAPTLADCCLVPQVYSARRFELDLAAYPAIAAVAARAAEHPAFQAAHPDRQPDARPANA
jgi:maleylacetoacetate isomerase